MFHQDARYHQAMVPVVDILSWLDGDRALPIVDRERRDALLAAAVQARDPCDRVVQWWTALGVDVSSPQLAGRRWIQSFRHLALALFFAGAIAGAMALGGINVLDEERPVNLLLVAVLFLLFPALGLVLSALALLPRRGTAHRTGPFALNGPVHRWLDRVTGIGRVAERWPLIETGRLMESHLLLLPQWFTAGLLSGALVALLCLVLFTDLAFGWSTTLEVSPQTVHAVCGWLALPWSGWLPVAVPDLTLVEMSRFFRLESRGLDRGGAAALGQWWPFVGMTILVWGLLPRLLLVQVMLVLLQRRARQLLLSHPEVNLLLERLAPSPLDVEAQQRVEIDQSVSAGTNDASVDGLGSQPLRIIWNDCLALTVAGELPATVKEPVRAGVRQTNAEWDALARQLESSAVTGVELLVAGWEPPLLSLRDFLSALCRRREGSIVCVVTPVNVEGSGVAPADHAVWQQTLAEWSIPDVTVASHWERP